MQSVCKTLDPPRLFVCVADMEQSQYSLSLTDHNGPHHNSWVPTLDQYTGHTNSIECARMRERMRICKSMTAILDSQIQ